MIAVLGYYTFFLHCKCCGRRTSLEEEELIVDGTDSDEAEGEKSNFPTRKTRHSQPGRRPDGSMEAIGWDTRNKAVSQERKSHDRSSVYSTQTLLERTESGEVVMKWAQDDALQENSVKRQTEAEKEFLQATK